MTRQAVNLSMWRSNHDFSVSSVETRIYLCTLQAATTICVFLYAAAAKIHFCTLQQPRYLSILLSNQDLSLTQESQQISSAVPATLRSHESKNVCPRREHLKPICFLCRKQHDEHDNSCRNSVAYVTSQQASS